MKVNNGSGRKMDGCQSFGDNGIIQAILLKCNHAIMQSWNSSKNQKLSERKKSERGFVACCCSFSFDPI
jgi:hypothetical protein